MEWSSPADQALVLGRSRGSGKGWRHHCGMGAAMPSSQLVTEYWPWLCSCLWKQDPAFTATLITSHLKAAQAGLTKAPTLGGRPAASRSAWNNPGSSLLHVPSRVPSSLLLQPVPAWPKGCFWNVDPTTLLLWLQTPAPPHPTGLLTELSWNTVRIEYGISVYDQVESLCLYAHRPTWLPNLCLPGSSIHATVHLYICAFNSHLLERECHENERTREIKGWYYLS